MDRRSALLIGTGKYDDAGLPSLAVAASDVASLHTVLEDPTVGAFDSIDVLVDAPNEELRRKVARFFSNRKRGDLLLLYISCHGLLGRNGELYFAARDTDQGVLVATALAASFVRQLMDDCSSRRQVIILDCCHSGAFERGTKGAVDAAARTGQALEGNGFGRVVLTATNSAQWAMEGSAVGLPDGHSAFTHFLLEGLNEGRADLDNDGLISVDELYQYARDRLIDYSPAQSPAKWTYQVEGRFVIARGKSSTSSDPLPNELPSQAMPRRRPLLLRLPSRRAVLTTTVGVLAMTLLGVGYEDRTRFHTAFSEFDDRLDSYILRARNLVERFYDAATEALDQVAHPPSADRKAAASGAKEEKERRLRASVEEYNHAYDDLRGSRERDVTAIDRAFFRGDVSSAVKRVQALALDEIHGQDIRPLREVTRDIDRVEKTASTAEVPTLLEGLNVHLNKARESLGKLEEQRSQLEKLALGNQG